MLQVRIGSRDIKEAVDQFEMLIPGGSTVEFPGETESINSLCRRILGNGQYELNRLLSKAADFR